MPTHDNPNAPNYPDRVIELSQISQQQADPVPVVATEPLPVQPIQHPTTIEGYLISRGGDAVFYIFLVLFIYRGFGLRELFKRLADSIEANRDFMITAKHTLPRIEQLMEKIGDRLNNLDHRIDQLRNRKD